MAQLKAPFVTTQATRDNDGIPSGTGENYLYVVTTSRYFSSWWYPIIVSQSQTASNNLGGG